MMYRVLAIVAGGVTLAACTSTPSWMNSMPSWNMDAWKPAPIMETVRFESEPAGAEAKTTTGQTCRTPCALAVPVGNGVSVTFTLNGYTPETEKIELVSLGSEGGASMQPNPVMVELTPAPPPPKKPAPATKKPAPKKKPATASAPATSAPAAASSAASPWPSQAR